MTTNTAPIQDDSDLFGEDDDSFDTATGSAFVKMEDLLGRLILVKPTDAGTRESTMQGAKPGDTYEYVECDVAVLDGDITDMIETVPTVLEAFQFSGASVVSVLKPKLRKGTRLLGRLGQHKAAKFKTSMGWHFDEPSEADIATAKAYLKAQRAARV